MGDAPLTTRHADSVSQPLPSEPEVREPPSCSGFGGDCRETVIEVGLAELGSSELPTSDPVGDALQVGGFEHDERVRVSMPRGHLLGEGDRVVEGCMHRLGDAAAATELPVDHDVQLGKCTGRDSNHSTSDRCVAGSVLYRLSYRCGWAGPDSNQTTSSPEGLTLYPMSYPP